MLKSRPLLRNKFLYYNNETRKFEGISLQSTYTTFRNLTIITTTTLAIPSTRTSANSFPLYSQFLYTIKTKHNSHYLLNDQSEFGSKLRLNLLKEISRYFNLDYKNLRLNWIQSLNESQSDSSESSSELILVSLSDIQLLNLQKIYLNIFDENNERKMDTKFMSECEAFYENLREKHQNLENFLNIQKIQFIKLCNLTQIRLIFSQKDQLVQEEMSKSLIQLNTQDINWIDDFDYYLTNETIILTNLKSVSNRTSSELVTKVQSFFDYLNEAFWSIVPEEDFLLAVIVPSIVVISLIVLSVVVVCMLQMCKKQSVSDTRHLISNSNTAESSSCNTKTFERTNPLYKEKAYMSKGVPVILYEEMSDKRVCEFENDEENLSSTTGSFRSPLIMRNEKPPVPAPPEYSRPAYYTPQLKASESILNELQSMLQQSANIISLAETPKQLSPSKSIKSISTENTPVQFDNEEHVILISSKNNKNKCSLIKNSDIRLNQNI